MVHGEVGPVVFALLEFVPGFFEDGLPGFVAEELPEGGGGDLDAVVEVGAVGEVGDFEDRGRGRFLSSD